MITPLLVSFWFCARWIMVRDVQFLLASLVFCLPIFAQAHPDFTDAAPGCGATKTSFKITLAKGDNNPPQHEAGKALVYFIQDDNFPGLVGKFTVRWGVDGKWVGATRGNSYLHLTLDPGVHHICADRVALVGLGAETAMHSTVDSDGVYYFRVHNNFEGKNGLPPVILEALDGDQGKLLTQQFKVSTSERKN
jgi:hypothetical protein